MAGHAPSFLLQIQSLMNGAWVQDDRINHAAVLFPGVGCFLIAAITGLFLHASNMDDVRAKLGTKTGGWLSKDKCAHAV